MQTPQMLETARVAKDTDLLGSWMPVPGLGQLPCNAYLIKSKQPVLVDTGIAALATPFMDSLEKQIDLDDLRWIWITHMDPDHIGNLNAILAKAPKARVVTNYLGMGKMGLLGLPQERAYLINPGQHLDVGDRQILALRPPTYDAPETCALFDTRSRAFFCADSFGVVQQTQTDTAEAIDVEALYQGMSLWNSVDTPWLAMSDAQRLNQALDAVHRLQADVILGSHLQPARGIVERLTEGVRRSREAPNFVGPDQKALEAMMTATMAEAA